MERPPMPRNVRHSSTGTDAPQAPYSHNLPLGWAPRCGWPSKLFGSNRGFFVGEGDRAFVPFILELGPYKPPYSVRRKRGQPLPLGYHARLIPTIKKAPSSSALNFNKFV
jgi:hypothetical protein